MDWDTKLQRIIDYIENHLQQTEETVDIEEIADIAGCSFNFFQKVFSYMNGISFAEYIRFRKLTLAGYDFKSSDAKVVDVSLRYGYESPTSFTKAFQKFHGISPKEARDPNSRLQVFPRMKVNTDKRYSWRLERKPAIHLIGKKVKISCKNGEQYVSIPGFWNDCQKNGVFSELVRLDTGKPPGLFGLFLNYDTENQEAEYAIMVNSDLKKQEGFCEILIPDETWAVFDCYGAVPGAVQNGWKYLNEEWLEKYPFRHAQCPEMEWYSDGNVYAEDYLSQIWIPVAL